MSITEVVADLPLSGRVAMVTGAAQGVGRACAVALARAGCLVALARTLAEEEKDHGITVNAVVAGHARPEEIGRVIAFLASPASESITGARIRVGNERGPELMKENT